ncbi:MAG: thymidine phosphorylase [Armatimonadetes bacterium]|nr:thymidine phosphorylase [Armatimonadota bacterium]
MRAYDIIYKKRSAKEMTRDEIEFMIDGYTRGEISDAQMAAWLMAVCIHGMADEETTDLALVMACSGRMLDLSSIPGVKVDKHSTGGVGDKTTLVLMPLLAAAGIPIVKMSGRSLGHTGGTVDKLESIPGFRTNLAPEEMVEQARRIGIVIAGIVPALVPADKKIYALRDETATVDCAALIAASVMSKKIAAGADAILLDVKTGSGAFVRNVEDAEHLAKIMVEIGRRTGHRTVAAITDMNQPLGQAIGNAIEVKEAIDTLHGRGPKDLVNLCAVLGGLALMLSGKAASAQEGRAAIHDLIRSGRGLEKFRELVEAQGGDPGVVNDATLLPSGPIAQVVESPEEGYIAQVDAFGIAQAAMAVGCGRTTPGARPNPASGIYLHKKTGDYVSKREPLATIYAPNEASAETAHSLVLRAYSFTLSPPTPGLLVHKVIGLDVATDTAQTSSLGA